MRQVLPMLTSVLLAVTFAVPAANAATGQAMPSSTASGSSIKFVSGGADQQSRERMKQMAADYNLLLNFNGSKADQDYKDVQVSITDDNGKLMLNASSGGPLFYIEVPPGHYAVTADLHGKHLIKSVQVAAHETSRLTFNWQT